MLGYGNEFAGEMFPSAGTEIRLGDVVLVNTERGSCYTFDEMKGWLEGAGFVDVEFVDCFEQPSLMIARKEA